MDCGYDLVHSFCVGREKARLLSIARQWAVPGVGRIEGGMRNECLA